MNSRLTTRPIFKKRERARDSTHLLAAPEGGGGVRPRSSRSDREERSRWPLGCSREWIRLYNHYMRVRVCFSESFFSPPPPRLRPLLPLPQPAEHARANPRELAQARPTLIWGSGGGWGVGGWPSAVSKLSPQRPFTQRGSTLLESWRDTGGGGGGSWGGLRTLATPPAPTRPVQHAAGCRRWDKGYQLPGAADRKCRILMLRASAGGSQQAQKPEYEHRDGHQKHVVKACQRKTLQRCMAPMRTSVPKKK